MKKLWFLLLLCSPLLMEGQDLPIYKNKLPEHIEKHGKSGLVRLSKDSIVLLDDIRIGTYRRIEFEKKGKKHLYYVFVQNNGKPIGHAMIKDPVKCMVVLYEDRIGSEIEKQYSPQIDEYERIVFFARYFIVNGYL